MTITIERMLDDHWTIFQIKPDPWLLYLKLLAISYISNPIVIKDSIKIKIL